MSEKVFTNKIINQLLEKYKTIWSLGHALALADWDLNTYMPEDGVIARGEMFAKISTLEQKLFLDKDFVKLIKLAENEKNLNDYEKGVLRVLKRSLKRYEKLPPDFLEEFSKVTSESQMVWARAKKSDDFSIFAPYLDKIVDLTLRQSEYIGYKKHPYDALLDDYEENLLVSDLDKYFDSVRDFLIDLLSYINKSSNFLSVHPLEKGEYNIDKMKKLNLDILSFFNSDPKKLRLDVSSHPFSQYLGRSDARITTRYSKNNFQQSLSCTIHEFGHALYNLQCDPSLDYTPIDQGSSLVVHESLSRFWENIIGKSESFTKNFHSNIISLSSEMRKYSTKDIYRYFNLVKPSLIRVEADEITYHFHIMIRYEIEKDLLEGKIKTKELPEVWNAKYKKYLGVTPKKASEGILQDIHWSMGCIGYFPTYSMGSSLSAMWKFYLEKDLGNIDELIKKDDGVQKIQNWLKNKIHKYGTTYTFKELVKKSTGEGFTTKYFKDYLTDKYKKIY